jgi:hypothetical protein
MSASFAQLASPQANNLMSLYLQAYQRDRAEDQINHGLALIAANHAGNPGMARAIMDSAGGRGDPGGMVGNMISLYQTQQQMGAQQDMLKHAPDYDAKLNLPPGTARDMIMAGRGSELVGQLMPTPATRDIDAKHDMFIKSGGTEEDWKTNYLPFIISSGAGGGDAATQSWRTERIRWQQGNPGQPFPWGQDDPQSFALWKTKQDEMAKDQEDANNKLPGYTGNLTTLRGQLGNIIGLKPGGDPNNKDDYDPAKVALLQSALSKPGAQAYLSGDPTALATQALGAALSPEEKALLDQIRETTDPKQLLGTLNARAPKRGVSDVTQIGSGLEGMRNVRRSPADWVSGVQKTIASTDTGIGNAYGAAGHAENAPDYTKPMIDQNYLPGGSLYPYGKKPAPMSSGDIADATAKIKAAKDPEAERQLLIKIGRANNADTTPLEKMAL